MWLFLVHSEHVKGKEAVSEEIGNFTTNCTSGTRAKAWVCKVRPSESEKGELEGQAKRRLDVYTLEEVIMKHGPKLMYSILHEIRSEGRTGSMELERGRGKQREVICHASPPCKSDVHI